MGLPCPKNTAGIGCGLPVRLEPLFFSLSGGIVVSAGGHRRTAEGSCIVMDGLKGSLPLPSAASRMQVMGDMGAFADRVLGEIGRARRRVDIECFIVRADRLGGELARALTAAAARGVRCRLLYDPLGCRSTDRSYF